MGYWWGKDRLVKIERQAYTGIYRRRGGQPLPEPRMTNKLAGTRRVFSF
jgi:hypothetical protein